MAANDEKVALNNILKGLRKVELDFKRLTEKLQKSESYNISAEASQILEGINEQLSKLHSEVSKILNYRPAGSSASSTVSIPSPPIIVRCKHWEDFKSQAFNAESLSFLCREEEKTFQVDAIKGHKIYTYSGQLPNTLAMLKAWLSKEINIEESKVVEG
ncbi:hypothetical protein KEJ32_03560, partial [Candidatus Bathyarchaeota archaeon]|nr:hypothetical protein [Candidatus Bathyarchaeota archaeon]